MARQQDSLHTVRAWQRIIVWGLTASLIATISFLLDHLIGLKSLAADAETARLEEEFVLRQDLFGLRSVMGVLQLRVDHSADQLENASVLGDRLVRTEETLGRIGDQVEAQATDLQRIESEYTGTVPNVLVQEFSLRDARDANRWESLTAQVATVEEATAMSLSEVERLEADLHAERDLVGMWRELVGPVVQLAGELSVGSGVLLESHPNDATGAWNTHLITAWHVVRDIQGDLEHTDMPVPVYIYDESGSIRLENARLLVFDAEIDVALLMLTTPDKLENGARLASPGRLAEVRIFDEVYAVGCPLGNDPIPTHGEIATISHRVDDETYWMINAPTYIGNSGGGIFDSERHELLGIFSKIYTHGSLRPTIVPHMGLVTPLVVVYEWLAGEGYASLIPGEPEGELPRSGSARLASASAPD